MADHPIKRPMGHNTPGNGTGKDADSVPTVQSGDIHGDVGSGKGK